MVLGVAFEARRKCICSAVDGDGDGDGDVSDREHLPGCFIIFLPSSCPSLCLRACLRLFARINDVIQLKWNFSHLTAHMQRQHERMRQEDEAGAVWVDVAR